MLSGTVGHGPCLDFFHQTTQTAGVPMRSHDKTRSPKSLASFGIAALLAMTAATAQVATGTTGIDASGSYRSEVQACNTGKTQQDRDTCLKEARNAQADKKRGVLDNAGAQFEAN